MDIVKNIKLFTTQKSDNVLTIWFWRNKKSDGGFYHSRTFNISWMYNIWKKNKVKPYWGYRDNGARKSNKNDTCFDGTIGLGYLQLNYINWNLQNK